MKIFNTCYDDYANFALDNTKALQSIGVNAFGLKRVAHPFSYETELGIANDSEIKAQIEAADFVQIFHSDIWSARVCEYFKKPYAVYHTGTAYRNSPDEYNQMFNSAKLVMTDQTEFLSLGNMKYIATAIDTNKIKPIPKLINIAHYPSNSNVKGTSEIIEMMSELNIPFEYSTKIVQHNAQLQRVGECEIYIELFKPELNGKPYGCFGVSAFEAAAMGCCVITQNINEKVYTDVYGDSPFYLANDKEMFKFHVQRLFNAQENIISLCKLSRQYIVDRHSYKATGQRIINEIKNSL